MKLRLITMPILILLIGILVMFKYYNLTDFEINTLTIGAFFLTIASAILGSHTSERINKMLISIKGIFVALGIVFILSSKFLYGFIYFTIIENYVGDFDTTGILLVGISLALILFNVQGKFNDNKKRDIDITIKELQKENEVLVRENSKVKEEQLKMIRRFKEINK